LNNLTLCGICEAQANLHSGMGDSAGMAAIDKADLSRITVVPGSVQVSHVSAGFG